MSTLISEMEFSIFEFRFWIKNILFPKCLIIRWNSAFSFVRQIPVLGLLIFTLVSCTGDLITSETLVATNGQSPYITTIFDYQYGPGQHAPMISTNYKGADFIGEPWKNGKTFVLLGGWGGYLVAGFDHLVENKSGPDIALFTQPSVASEPGIIYVMADNNKDGLPNDGPWLEIKGSEYNNPETIHNYQVTYFKPETSGYVTWKDNQGKEGKLVPQFDSGSWWWSGYGTKTAITFSGVRLPNAYENNSNDSAVEFWSSRSGLFRFGYAECYENEDYNQLLKANLIDISSAVDSAGLPVNLAGINFIKVQSSVFQIAGWLNEISTEVSGAADLGKLDKKSYQ